MPNTHRTSRFSTLMAALFCTALGACGGGGSDTTMTPAAAPASTATSTPTPTPASVQLPVTRLNKPNGIAIDALGDLYVADRGNFTVRKITPAGIVSTLAGTPGISGTRDGLIITDGVNGPTAQFSDLRAIAVHRTPDNPTDVMAPATIYLIDGNTVRKIPLDNDLNPGDEIVETIMGCDQLVNPTGIAVEQNDTQSIYITDAGGVNSCGVAGPPRIVKIAAGGITNFATGLLGPRGIAIDAAHNLFITDVDPRSGATLIKKVTPTGVVSTLSGAGPGQSFTNGGPIAVNAVGGVVFAQPTSIVVLAANGTPTAVPVSAAQLVSLSGITFDADGTNFVVTDSGNDTVSKVTTAGALTPFAGAPGQPGSIDSPGVFGPQINN